MQIIWVRHGTVDKDSHAADTLTRSGRDFAARLPRLLEDNGIMPEVVFYDASEKSDKIIERCRETVLRLEERAEMIRYSVKDVKSIFERCKSVDQAVVCYTSESLKYFPKIKGAICEKYMGDDNCDKAPESITNKLYEQIIVSEFDGSVIRLVCTIPTGDHR